MSSTAILLLVAGVLSMDGDLVRVDAGRVAGLRVGDRGVVFYQLKVRDESRRVEVGGGEVTEVDDGQATVRVDAGAQVRSGYRVEFSIPVTRLAPPPEPSTAEADRLRGRLKTAESRIDELEGQARAVTDRAALLEREARVASERAASLESQAGGSSAQVADLKGEIADLKEKLLGAHARAEELEREAGAVREAEDRAAALETQLREATARAAGLERSLAEAATERETAVDKRAGTDSALAKLQGQLDESVAEQQRLADAQLALEAVADERIALLTTELEAAQAAVLRLEQSASEAGSQEADPPPATTERDVAPRTAVDPADMERIEEGEYEVGRDAAQASFYNQTPRFKQELAAFWIDRELVASTAYEQWRGSAPVAPAARYQIGVTFGEAEAYCRAQGKRLPTEAEWEVAMTVAELEGVASLLEWTGSWYQPYPGNKHPEADYGRRFRVVRASAGDRRERRYMLPEARDSVVGFRCVQDSPETP